MLDWMRMGVFHLTTQAIFIEQQALKIRFNSWFSYFFLLFFFSNDQMKLAMSLLKNCTNICFYWGPNLNMYIFLVSVVRLHYSSHRLKGKLFVCHSSVSFHSEVSTKHQILILNSWLEHIFVVTKMDGIVVWLINKEKFLEKFGAKIAILFRNNFKTNHNECVSIILR